MKGIRFGNLHTYDNYGLILTAKELGAPETKTQKIDIECADSSLDLTDFFSAPNYQDVTHSFTFAAVGTQAELIAKYQRLKNALHGKKQRIILDDDSAYYYVGRCFVSSFANTKNMAEITIECECEPYKYKLLQTSLTFAVSGT